MQYHCQAFEYRLQWPYLAGHCSTTSKYGPQVSYGPISPANTPNDIATDVPWLDKVRNSEDRAKYYANAPNGDVCYAKERIFASHYGSRRYDYRFCTSIDSDREI